MIFPVDIFQQPYAEKSRSFSIWINFRGSPWILRVFFIRRRAVTKPLNASREALASRLQGSPFFRNTCFNNLRRKKWIVWWGRSMCVLRSPCSSGIFLGILVPTTATNKIDVLHTLAWILHMYAEKTNLLILALAFVGRFEHTVLFMLCVSLCV